MQASVRAITVVAFALASGCRGGDASRGQTDRTADTPSSTGARVDKQAEERAIRAVETRWREVIRNRDTAAIAGFYTEDAIYAPQDRPVARGRAAVSAMWAKDEFSYPDVSMERTPIRIDVAESGDVATEIGTWVFRATIKGRPWEGRGAYVFGWRKVGGEWKASAYMWNTGKAPVL